MSSKPKRARYRGPRRAQSPDTAPLSSPSGRPKSDPARARRAWFASIALLAPVLLLVLLELLLRLGGFGYPTSFFRQTHQAGHKILVENARFGWRFFPRQLARAPRPIALPADKAPGTCRIFVLGESAALGDPEPAYGFPRLLEALLKGRFPAKKIEVVNAAMTAINSNVILPIARDCAGQRGDIWVIYMGNNEVVGPFGAGTIFGAQVPNLTLLRAGLALKSTRIGQLVGAAETRLGMGWVAPPAWRGMEMFLRQQIRQDDSRLETVYAHFRRNLEDILRTAVRSGVKVVIATVVSNLKDCAPLGSLHRLDLTAAELARWEKAYQAGAQFEAAGQFDEALAALHQAGQIDPSYADLQFRLARCSQAIGQFEEARRWFEAARDLDSLRFRCDSRLNQIIRDVAGNRTGDGIYLVDAAAEFARGSPHGLTGGELLVDHVHFGFEGNYLLAGLIGQRIVTALPLIEGAVKRAWPSMTDCARSLALSGWDRYQLVETMRQRLEKPPFTRQLNHAELIAGLEAQLQGWRAFNQPAALPAWREVYRQALAASADDWELHRQLARLLEVFGQRDEAIGEWRRVVDLVPQYAVAHYQLGRLLDRGADRREAKQQLLEALASWPDFPDALNSLGIVLAHENRFADADRQFARALQLQPDFADAQLNWALTLAAAGQTSEALAHYSNAVSLEPENAQLRLKLGVAFEKQRKISLAVEQFRAALRLDPTNRVARESLARAEALLPKPPGP
ncbi:MAG: tetratricopeptide repeat protein [Limisphaerales bacterium]